MADKLPVFRLLGDLYYWDKRLREYRMVSNPTRRVDGDYVDNTPDIQVKLVELNNANI